MCVLKVNNIRCESIIKASCLVLGLKAYFS